MVTLGSPRHSQKPPVRPAAGLKSLRHNPNWSWYLPPSQHPLPEPYRDSAPHHPRPGYHCVLGNPEMPKVRPKDSVCPFWGGGGGPSAQVQDHVFSYSKHQRRSSPRHLWYRATWHPLSCSTPCPVVPSITPRTQPCLPTSPHRSLPS